MISRRIAFKNEAHRNLCHNFVTSDIGPGLIRRKLKEQFIVPTAHLWQGVFLFPPPPMILCKITINY